MTITQGFAYDQNAAPLLAARGHLRRLANSTGVLFGAAVDANGLADLSYRTALDDHFSMIEPENALKWAAIRPSRDTFDFSDADAIVRMARESGHAIRGHVLAWHAYNPWWLRSGRFEPRQLSHVLHEHIETVVGHFAEDMFAWDVVNEVVSDGAPGRLRSSIWYDRPGIGFAEEGARYVAEMFRWARAAAPRARLFYNDDPASTPRRADAMRRLLTDLLDRGAPIDGVGLQLHLDLATDLSRIAETLGRFAGLGLEIHVTELDVAIPTGPDGRAADPRDLDRQADIYHQVVSACLRLPRCTAIQVWGVDDGHSWIPAISHGAFGAALLLDQSHRPKPAYGAVASAFEGFVTKRPRLERSS